MFIIRAVKNLVIKHQVLTTEFIKMFGTTKNNKNVVQRFEHNLLPRFEY